MYLHILSKRSTLHPNLSAFVWYGVAGGVLGPVLSLVQWSRTPQQERPSPPLYDAGFWLGGVLLALLGGFAVFLYEHTNVVFNPVLAVHIGASAPILFQQLLSTAAPVGKTG
jgi:hypothetical protein